MDPIKAEKLRVLNSYKKCTQFLYNLILSSFIAVTFSLLCSYPYWFPSLCCTTKHFLFTSLTNISTFCVNPKCLFIVVNVIVVFLVGESKLVGSKPSPVNELYGEYVERSHGLRFNSTLQERKVERSFETMDGNIQGNHSLGEDSNSLEQKEKRKFEMETEASANKIEGKEAKEVKAEDDGGRDDEEAGDDQEETGLPAEELNRRAEEFIARVNKQMRLEAKLLVCTRA